jgi:outer membrane protein OmpA-like peptidoglycan-associated protein
MNYGIQRRRIQTIGYGGSRPIAPNDNEENRAKNRRVEIRFLEEDS